MNHPYEPHPHDLVAVKVVWPQGVREDGRDYKPGATLKMDGCAASGFLIDSRLLGSKFALNGLLLGTLKLLEAGTNPGQPVSGRVEADVYQFLR